jgi:hypothetical protein
MQMWKVIGVIVAYVYMMAHCLRDVFGGLLLCSVDVVAHCCGDVVAH